MRSEFVTSAPVSTAFPAAGLPEIAFCGRSNVGKSSLLNRLCGAKIARTSRTPGRTQAVNFFSVHGRDGDYMLADLPGYGFAKAPKSVRGSWYGLIETYLGRELAAVLMLIDIRRDVTAEDREIFEWLEDNGAKVHVIATKADKLSKAHRKPVANKIGVALGADRQKVLPVSSLDGLGIEELRERLGRIAVRQNTVDSRDLG